MRRKNLKIVPILFTAVLAFLASGELLLAQDARERLVPFGDFVQSVVTARFEGYALRKGTRAAGEPEFERMRQHVLALYEGMDGVRHSFMMDAQTFDCIAIEQQPSVRQLGLEKVLLEAPDPNPSPVEGTDRTSGGGRGLPSPLTLGQVDAFGNEVSCEGGTIPMRRVTLEELTRFETLEAFFQKLPWDQRDETKGDVPPAAVVHKYAHAYQNVKNYGGNSWLNLWSPAVNTSQIFSLSQQWYSGGNGKKLQTVEGGWQVYPAKYRTNQAVLFIYWTADAYTKTGCYNLDCAAFVQTNRNWAFGGTWPVYSTRGGTQYEIQMQWKFVGGNWWLYLQGTGNYEAVGYYPKSIYKGGQLSRWATSIDYGGETVGSTSWPPMGSGGFASLGFQQAAYQRVIFYIDAAQQSRWSSLRASQPSFRCYTLLYTPSSHGGEWGSFFYFGGPGGGSSC